MPKNGKEIHSFLELASYHHQFIPKFACVAKCLHQPIGLSNVKKNEGKKKEVTTLQLHEQDRNSLIWISEHWAVFDALKVALTTAPVLVSRFDGRIYFRN